VGERGRQHRFYTHKQCWQITKILVKNLKKGWGKTKLANEFVAKFCGRERAE
jgi:hypothetical protein